MSLPSFRVSALRRREQYPGLVAAWGFDEGTGTIARDSSEHNLPLTLSGGVVTGQKYPAQNKNTERHNNERDRQRFSL